ncbi:hypothetical protein [Gynurincola endophyticus]|uniref:hypothetical protein n=1 Tax=Gynurincola endophyticus TaxID=2479004 RepID=UPI000F8D1512|nr:hypothetical protein [Gynurincola endophyticus]
MKISKIISILTCLAMLIACQKDKEPLPDTRKTYLTRITTGEAIINFTYDSENRLVKEETVYPSGIYPTRIVEYSLFDDHGNARRVTGYNATTPDNRTYQEAEYDSQNRITRRTTLFNEGGTLVVFRYATYAYSGNFIEKKTFDNAHNQINESVYGYDDNDNILYERNYNERGEQTFRRNYTAHDDKHSFKEFLSPFSDWKLQIGINNALTYTNTFPASGGGSLIINYTLVHEYNEDGYVTKTTTTASDGGGSQHNTYQYEKW